MFEKEYEENFRNITFKAVANRRYIFYKNSLLFDYVEHHTSVNGEFAINYNIHDLKLIGEKMDKKTEETKALYYATVDGVKPKKIFAFNIYFESVGVSLKIEDEKTQRKIYRFVKKSH